jgi:ribose/xylose/arabinose/galactoside ABC-type transport system permease subunit
MTAVMQAANRVPIQRRAMAIDWLSRYAAGATTVLVLFVALVWTPAFYSSGNLRTVVLQASVLGVVVLGQTVVLLVRGLDMSVNAMVAISGVLLVSATGGAAIGWKLLLVVAIAFVIGLANGLLVTLRKVPAFIASFAVLIVASGALLAYTRGQTSGSSPGWMIRLGSGSLFGLPVPLLIWGGMALTLFILLTRTTWGRWIYATGASPEAARHGGVPVSTVIVSAFVVSALCAMVGGLLLSGYLGYVDQSLGSNANLNSIAAAIIGGVAFSGGRGGIGGAAVGAVLLTVLTNIVVVAGLPIFWQLALQGLVLILAVSIQGLRARWVPGSG